MFFTSNRLVLESLDFLGGGGGGGDYAKNDMITTFKVILI